MVAHDFGAGLSLDNVIAGTYSASLTQPKKTYDERSMQLPTAFQQNETLWASDAPFVLFYQMVSSYMTEMRRLASVCPLYYVNGKLQCSLDAASGASPDQLALRHSASVSHHLLANYYRKLRDWMPTILDKRIKWLFSYQARHNLSLVEDVALYGNLENDWDLSESPEHCAAYVTEQSFRETVDRYIAHLMDASGTFSFDSSRWNPRAVAILDAQVILVRFNHEKCMSINSRVFYPFSRVPVPLKLCRTMLLRFDFEEIDLRESIRAFAVILRAHFERDQAMVARLFKLNEHAIASC